MRRGWIGSIAIVIFIAVSLIVTKAAAEPPIIIDSRGWIVDKANGAVIFEFLKEDGKYYRGKYVIRLGLISKFCDYDNLTGKVIDYTVSYRVPKYVGEVYNLTEEQHFLRAGYWEVLAVYIPKYPNINLLERTVTFVVYPSETVYVGAPISLTDLTLYAKDYVFTPQQSVKFVIETPLGREYKFTDSEGKAIFTDIYSKNMKLVEPDLKLRTNLENMESNDFYIPTIPPELIYLAVLFSPIAIAIFTFYGFWYSIKVIKNFIYEYVVDIYLLLSLAYYRFRRFYRYKLSKKFILSFKLNKNRNEVV